MKGLQHIVIRQNRKIGKSGVIGVQYAQFCHKGKRQKRFRAQIGNVQCFKFRHHRKRRQIGDRIVFNQQCCQLCQSSKRREVGNLIVVEIQLSETCDSGQCRNIRDGTVMNGKRVKILDVFEIGQITVCGNACFNSNLCVSASGKLGCKPLGAVYDRCKSRVRIGALDFTRHNTDRISGDGDFLHPLQISIGQCVLCDTDRFADQCLNVFVDKGDRTDGKSFVNRTIFGIFIAALEDRKQFIIVPACF